MRYLLCFLLACAMTCAVSSGLRGEVQTKTIEYSDGQTKFEGFVAFDPAKTSQGAPGVLVVHQWLGLTDYEKSRCQQLAELGYVAFALDIYGKGVRPSGVQEAGSLPASTRVIAAVSQATQPGTGTVEGSSRCEQESDCCYRILLRRYGVLELARSGADVAGVVSFHGGLDAPTPADANNIKAKFLICHGNDDPFRAGR